MNVVQDPVVKTPGSGRTLLSIVVPVFNEEDNILPLYERVCSTMQTIADRYDFELVFTDNHSTDETFARIRDIAARDDRVRAARFSRNFGHQRSIWTGYRLARGAAAIQLDGDIQDPPELIPDFVAAWEAGHKVVYGIRRTRKEGWLNGVGRKLFYRLVAALSENPPPLDAGDFRLIDRVVIDQLSALRDVHPYLRGSIAQLGFSQIGIPYDRDARARGESKFHSAELIGLALDGILSQSVVPLRVATYVGLLVALLTFLGLLAAVVGKLLLGNAWPAGLATTWALVLLSITLNALFLGIIGEYVGRIYNQVKAGPMTVVEESVGPESPPRGEASRR
jgi:dolichol-phosphate mannosyltransferase